MLTPFESASQINTTFLTFLELRRGLLLNIPECYARPAAPFPGGVRRLRACFEKAALLDNLQKSNGFFGILLV
jgi:hypothetical protein